jgi:hypothetical protein
VAKCWWLSSSILDFALEDLALGSDRRAAQLVNSIHAGAKRMAHAAAGAVSL